MSGVKTAGKCMDESITSRPESQALPLFRALNNFVDHFSGFFGRGVQFRDFFDFGSNLWNSGHGGVKTAGKCMDESITSRPESQALPLFRAPNNFLYHFSGYCGSGAPCRDFCVSGPKRPNLGRGDGTF